MKAADVRPQQVDGFPVVYMPVQPPEGSRAVPQGGPHAMVTYLRVGDHWRSRHGNLTWESLLASARSAGVQVMRPSRAKRTEAGS